MGRLIALYRKKTDMTCRDARNKHRMSYEMTDILPEAAPSVHSSFEKKKTFLTTGPVIDRIL